MDVRPNDEIDLQELAVKTIRYFKRHFIFVLISSLVGLGLGIFAYRTLPSVYESKMIVFSDLLTRTYGERIDESLNNLIAEGNTNALSAKLSLSPEEASSITHMEVECIVEVKAIQRDKMERDETFFIVTVDLKDRTILPRLQEGIIAYFNNNEFVKPRVEMRKEMYAGIIEKIGKESSALDSLKRKVLRGQAKGEVMLDASALFSTAVELSESHWKYKQALALSGSIHLMEGFTVFEKPKDPKLLTLMVLGLVAGFVFSIGVLTLRQLFDLAR